MSSCCPLDNLILTLLRESWAELDLVLTSQLKMALGKKEENGSSASRERAEDVGGGREIQVEGVPLLQLPPTDQTDKDFGDGQTWSGRGSQLPRASSTHAFIQIIEDSCLPWDKDPPELVWPYQEDLDSSPFLKAASKGDCRALRQMTLEPFSMEAELALNLASRKGHDAIVKYLLKNEVSVHYKDRKSGFDAISMATYFDHGAVIETLMSSGQIGMLPKVEANGAELSLLHLAAFYGCLAALQTLVRVGKALVGVDERDRDRWTPLHYALSRRHTDIVKTLLENGANPNVKGIYQIRPLHVAAYREDVELVNLLLDHGADPCGRVSEDTPRYTFELHEIQYRKNKELPSAVTFNARKYSTLLHWAVSTGSTSLVRKMLRKGSTVDCSDLKGITPLGIALTEGHGDTITYFMKKGVKLSDEDKNWSRISDEETGLKVLRTLESTNLDSLQCANRDGLTLLHLAASQGYLNLLNHLLNREVNPDLETSKGETPIFFAIENNHQACVQQLVRANCNICHITHEDTSLLHTAAKYNNFAAIDMILRIVADGEALDINLTDKSGFTAIYYAINAGRYDIVQRFVQFCVSQSMHVKATENETLLQFYTKRNIMGQYDNAIVRVLELEKALHSSKISSEKCLRAQLCTTEASTKAREQLQAMYESTRVQLHCWNFWIVITCFIMPSILYFLDVYTDVLLAVEYYNDYIDSGTNGTNISHIQPLEIFNNIPESQSKVNLVLTVFFILFPMTLLYLWSLYVHLTQEDIMPIFKKMPRLQRAFLYFLLFLFPLGPVVSYIENSYAQIKYMNIISSEISSDKKFESKGPSLPSSSDHKRVYYNLKQVAQMRVAINNVLEATLESAFQLVLQLYILGKQYKELKKFYFGKVTIESILYLAPAEDAQSRLSKQVFSVLISLASLTWSFTAYHRFSKLGGLRILWSLPLLFAIFFQIVSRAIACTVFTLGCTWKIFIALAVHYLLVLLIKGALEERPEPPHTRIFDICNPCSSVLRSYFYVFLGAFTSTFVYFRIQRPLDNKEELSQRHPSFLIQTAFLLLAFLENVILFAFGTARLEEEEYDDVFKIVAGVLCLISFIIGVILQWVYYGCFGHPWVNINGPTFERDESGSVIISFHKGEGETQWVFRSCRDCTSNFVVQEDNIYIPRSGSRNKVPTSAKYVARNGL